MLLDRELKVFETFLLSPIHSIRGICHVLLRKFWVTVCVTLCPQNFFRVWIQTAQNHRNRRHTTKLIIIKLEFYFDSDLKLRTLSDFLSPYEKTQWIEKRKYLSKVCHSAWDLYLEAS